MPPNDSGGLPPRIYLPVFIVVAVVFLCIMAYLVADGFGVTGSVFGKAVTARSAGQMPRQGSQNDVEGGPPAPVVAELRKLRARIAAHPNDDVALAQLGDMYLASNHFEQAIPLYQRALRANPRNVAAQEGLTQARQALRQ
ncbi:MAG: tetratricopeptide repeat protein [Candidatus Cybelea sp.]